MALITFDKAAVFFENFEFGNLKFQKFFEQDQFFFLNYQPSIRQKISFLQNYELLFDEIARLCNQNFPSRIAFHQVDALLNMGSVQLSHLTAEKFGSACKSKLRLNSSLLAHFIKYPDANHQSMGFALEKISAGYFEILNNPKSNGHSLDFRIRKLPWFDFDTQQQTLTEEVIVDLLGRSHHHVAA